MEQFNESKKIEDSESNMLEEIQRGDQRAFARLVAAHEKSVYRICYRFFADENEASDAAQEVFVKVFRAIAKFEGRSSLKTWIYRIAANTCISLADKKKRDKEGLLQTMLNWWADSHQASPEETLVEREIQQLNQQIVSEKVARLPETYRMPVILKDIEGLPLEKIAEILEIPLGTVKSRINRGRRLLQESLQAYVYGRTE
ncbi:MAG TPA: sigma-70 family RNA polymerase sigma factor [Candidatus Rifleibacterium sp.]|nr:sigma-70 family RNA polymerase sigma factor [Candidatus Rifleibacterium sp.]HPT44801.1 sigma-70 family RNA polymerase sigma factor [Candidatus Rifleibacterium sp.]